MQFQEQYCIINRHLATKMKLKKSRKLKMFALFIMMLAALTFSEEAGYARSDISTYYTKLRLKKGLDFTGYLGQAASWGDFNNDGCLDLFISNTDINNHPSTYLFRNTCNGNFVEMGSSIGISDKYPIRSSAWADYNNDGYLDLVLGGIDVYMKPFLYSNKNGVMFEESSTLAGITQPGVGKSFVWTDYNLDGLIDLFESSFELHLYKNLGRKGFTDVTKSDITDYEKDVNASVWFDYDNDSYPDLFILRKGTNILLRNMGDETFSNVTWNAKIDGDYRWNSVAACTGDFNNDGFIDVYVVNIHSKSNSLYRNNGDGTFTDITENSNTADVGDGRTCSFVDFDSDGLIDIFTTNHVNPSKMYRNLGNEKFEDVAGILGIDKPVDAFSAAWGDFNRDAVMDVMLNGHLGKALYQGFNFNNAVNIELIGNGTDTNTSAIGTRVTLETGRGRQIRDVSGGKGCCEQDMLPVNFGLGSEKVFSFTVQWTNRETCRFESLNAEVSRIYKVWQKGCEIKTY